MDTLRDLILSGRIVDIMLALVALEVVVLLLVRRRHGAVAPLTPLLANVGAGVALMVALRFALTDSTWLSISVCLLAALVFHGADVALRWQHPAGSDRPNRQ